MYFLCGGCSLEADPMADEAFVYTFFEPFPDTSLLSSEGEVTALTGRPSKQREEHLEGTTPPPFLSLPHWNQKSTAFSRHSARTHTHTHLQPQFRMCRHTHVSLSQHYHRHTFARRQTWQSKLQRQRPQQVVSDRLPDRLRSPVTLPLTPIRPSAKSKASQFSLSIKLVNNKWHTWFRCSTCWHLLIKTKKKDTN